MSELSKSNFNSEKSYEEAYHSYSPRFQPVHRSSDWVSYEQESVSPYPGDLQAEKIYYGKLTQMQETLYAEMETLKSEKKQLSHENIQLRAKIQDLEKQIDAQYDKLQKKEKEINKLSFDKELFAKSEDEFRRAIEDYKRKFDFCAKENNEMKQAFEVIKIEKREVQKSFKELEGKSELMQKNLNFKDNLIVELQDTINLLEKSAEKNKAGFSSQKIKALTNKFTIKKIEIPEKRGISESPERKNLQLSDRDDKYKLLYSEARKMLNAETPSELREKIMNLKDAYLKYKKLKKFIDKLSDMIIQCSPSGSFNKEPSTHQIWKWLTRLLEEYMKIKQSISGESFNRLCQLLGTENIEEMAEKVTHLQNTRPRGGLRNV